MLFLITLSELCVEDSILSVCMCVCVGVSEKERESVIVCVCVCVLSECVCVCVCVRVGGCVRCVCVCVLTVPWRNHRNCEYSDSILDIVTCERLHSPLTAVLSLCTQLLY